MLVEFFCKIFARFANQHEVGIFYPVGSCSVPILFEVLFFFEKKDVDVVQVINLNDRESAVIFLWGEIGDIP